MEIRKFGITGEVSLAREHDLDENESMGNNIRDALEIWRQEEMGNCPHSGDCGLTCQSTVNLLANVVEVTVGCEIASEDPNDFIDGCTLVELSTDELGNEITEIVLRAE